jgi:predicted HD phosphohydrolase
MHRATISERASHNWNIAYNAPTWRQKLVSGDLCPTNSSRLPSFCFRHGTCDPNLTFIGSSIHTVVAALFHDIGQFLPAALLKGALEDTEVGRPNHASTGSAYLAGLGFPAKVTNIVAQHVASKRYLTATDLAYMDQLSGASKKSLNQQGGPMSEAELRAFENVDGWRECLVVRKWDDQAKLVGIEHQTPRVDSYEGMIASVLTQGGN